MNEIHFEKLIDQFNSDKDFILSKGYKDGGIDPLFPRLTRAVLNQINQGSATMSRYAIWTNTVRDNIIKADEEMKSGNIAEAHRLLCRAVNSLSAFSEVQKAFDTECMD